MRLKTLLPAIAAAAAATACDDVPPGPLGAAEDKGQSTLPQPTVVDYNIALRTASLKLLDEPPKLVLIKSIAKATNPGIAYSDAVDAMLADGRFRDRMVRWWKDTMRLGGAPDADRPSRETAPVFAAHVMLDDRPYDDIFTASSGTCPEYDEGSRAFEPADCENGVPVHAGVLSNPGVQHQFFSNMAFRRVRWVQEIFLCSPMPAEAVSGGDLQGGAYTSPWPLETISASPIDFRSTSSLVCGNCHTTINHIAPLFGRFDAAGTFGEGIQVQTPVAPAPLPTELSHWLSNGESTAWRYGAPAPDLPALGQAIAADPASAECAVARVWNFAMSKDDIVSDKATVPREVIQPFIDEFLSNGKNLKKVLRSILVSDDFVRF